MLERGIVQHRCYEWGDNFIEEGGKEDDTKEEGKRAMTEKAKEKHYFMLT